jgi:uncharacterized protein (DUF1786 family)
MSRFLMVDIGAGTMDVLYVDTESELHYKAVVKSPVRYVAERVAETSGNLVITGNEMGGGPITRVLTQRAQEAEVLISESAAATVHHNPDRVRSLGISILSNDEAHSYREKQGYSTISVGDLDPERLHQIVGGFGVPFGFDALVLCAQDHGVPPHDVSHLDYRHNLFAECLQSNPVPEALLYRADEVPSTMNRLRSMAKDAEVLPADEIYVMDSGMAAILGASMDIQARDKNAVLVLDIATSHTVGAALANEEIAGFFEYHTQDLTLQRLESLILDLADGRLDHKQILAEGGHGAFLRKALGFENLQVLVATGPKRKLIYGSKLKLVYGAPFGDNMMTGTVGLLEALRRRKGLAPMLYI